MMLFLFCVLLIYVVLIGFFIFGICKIKTKKNTLLTAKTSFTIVVPFRNEAKNLPFLLESLSNLNYPKDLFEVILIDDASDEKFRLSSFKFQVSVINNERKSNSPKKDAIETAIKLAKNAWIITTDADCLVQKDWLKTFDTFIQINEVKMIAGAVKYTSKNGFLHAFQNLDFLSLQGATLGSFGIGKPFMCNGANFAYQKDFFFELDGFSGNETIASGDDVFLLQKAIASQPNKVRFLYDERSVVTTKSVSSWKELFNQRVRWASKSTGYQSVFGKIVALLVFATNLSFIAVVILWLSQKMNYEYALLFIGTKIIIDTLMLLKTNRYLKTQMRYVLISGILYPFYSTIIAFYSLFGKYDWKGRQFKK